MIAAVVLICISQMANDVDYQVIRGHLLWRSVYSNPLFFYLGYPFILSCISFYIFWIQVPYQICDLQKVSPVLWLVYYLLDNAL